MSELSLAYWFWWLWVGLVLIWWWPKVVKAEFRPEARLYQSEIVIGPRDTLLNSESSSSVPHLRLVSDNWGIVTDTQERSIWRLSDNGEHEILTNCHQASDLELERTSDQPCWTDPNHEVAVPYLDSLYIKTATDEYELLLPEMRTPAKLGELIISEVMWMGSFEGIRSKADDEWLELFNNTLETLDLSQIEITMAGLGDGSLFLPDGLFLPPQSYLVIGANQGEETLLAKDPDIVMPSLSLSNSKAGLRLINTEDIVLDSLPTGAWLVGLNNTSSNQRYSAQRMNFSEPGDSWVNWGHCSEGLLTVLNYHYWRESARHHNCGTPWEVSLF